MADIIRIRDLTPTEVAQLLETGGSHVENHEASAIKTIIDDLRNVEGEWAAVELMRHKFNDAA